MKGPILVVQDLQAGYERGAPILRGVSFDISRGEMLAVLGPNGAGKSTLIRAVAGLVTKFAGEVRLLGKDITSAMAHELVRAGLGFVPQTDNVFTHMPFSVNLRLAADILPKTERRSQIESMYVLFPDLARRPQLEAGRLSGGQRQMLAIARALIPRPQLLLLDEASAGLSPKLVGELLVKLRQIKAQGVTILLVEQNAKAALGAADRAVILNGGQIAHEGSCADLLRDRSIGQLFFGLKPKGTVV
jgi:branched-chain amino acid transport system ATP-binding protein